MDFYWNDSDENREVWAKWFEWLKELGESVESTFGGDQENMRDAIENLKENSNKIKNANIKSIYEEISNKGAASEPWERILWRCGCQSRMVEDSWGGWMGGSPSTMTFIVNLDDVESKRRYIVEMEEYACGDGTSFGMICHSCNMFLGPEEEIQVINEVDI